MIIRLENLSKLRRRHNKFQTKVFVGFLERLAYHTSTAFADFLIKRVKKCEPAFMLLKRQVRQCKSLFYFRKYARSDLIEFTFSRGISSIVKVGHVQRLAIEVEFYFRLVGILFDLLSESTAKR